MPLPPTPIGQGANIDTRPSAIHPATTNINSSTADATTEGTTTVAQKMEQVEISDVSATSDQLEIPDYTSYQRGESDSPSTLGYKEGGDVESISSKASSAMRARRRLQKQQAVDLSE